MSQPALIIFAREPVAGQAKTRLQPDYSPEQAAEIAAFMIRATVELAVSAWPGEVTLCAWPGIQHPVIQQIAREFQIKLGRQTEGNLGDKMLDALRQGVARHGAAAIMGCDVPQCGWDILDQANDWLARGRNVIGPARDGGYYLIGLQEARSELFKNVEWGGRNVLETTLKNAAAIGMEFDLLPVLQDIDTADDLWLVSQIYAPLRRFFPDKCVR